MNKKERKEIYLKLLTEINSPCDVIISTGQVFNVCVKLQNYSNQLHTLHLDFPEFYISFKNYRENRASLTKEENIKALKEAIILTN